MSVEYNSEHNTEVASNAMDVLKADSILCKDIYTILETKYWQDLVNYFKKASSKRIVYLQVLLHDAGKIPYKAQEGIGMNCKNDSPDGNFGPATQNALMRKRKELYLFLKENIQYSTIQSSQELVPTKKKQESFDTTAKKLTNKYNVVQTDPLTLYLILEQQLPSSLVDQLRVPLQKSDLDNVGPDQQLTITFFQNGLIIRHAGNNSILFSYNYYARIPENQLYLKTYLQSGLPLDRFDNCFKEYTCSPKKEEFIEFAAGFIATQNIAAIAHSGKQFRNVGNTKTTSNITSKCAINMRHNMADNTPDLSPFKNLGTNTFRIIDTNTLQHPSTGKMIPLTQGNNTTGLINIRNRNYRISHKIGTYYITSLATNITYPMLFDTQHKTLKVLPHGHARDVFQNPNYFSCGMTKVQITNNIPASYAMTIAHASEILKKTGGNAIPLYFQHKRNNYRSSAGSKYYSGFHAATLFFAPSTTGESKRYVQDPTFAAKGQGPIKPLDRYLKHMKKNSSYFTQLGMLNTSYSYVSNRNTENIALSSEVINNNRLST